MFYKCTNHVLDSFETGTSFPFPRRKETFPFPWRMTAKHFSVF